MSKFKALLVSLAFLIVIFVGAAFIVPSLIDWNGYEKPIQDALVTHTGLDAHIKGELSFDVLPYPRLVINDTSVSLESSEILSFEKLLVAVDLVPLISKQIKVDHIKIVKPRINIRRDEYERFNFMTDKLDEILAKKEDKQDDSASSQSEKFVYSVSINSFEVESGAVSYSDQKSGQSYEVENVNVELAAETLNGPFDISGDLDWKGETFHVDLSAGRLVDDMKSLPMKLMLSLNKAGASVKYSGVVGTKAPLDMQGDLAIESKDLNAIADQFSGARIGDATLPLKIKGLFTANQEQVSWADLSGHILERPFQGDVNITSFGTDFALSNKRPPHVKTSLIISDLGDVQDFIRSFAKGKTESVLKSSPSQIEKKNVLFPDSLVLAQDVNFDTSISIDKVHFEQNHAADVKVSIEKSMGKVVAEANVGKIGKNGSLSASLSLKYLSQSEGRNSGVVYSDPELKGDFSFNNFDGVTLLSNLSDEDSDPIIREMAKNVTVRSNIEASPAVVVLKDLNVEAADLQAVGNVRYDLSKKGHDRPVLDIGMNIDSLDADRLLALKNKDNPIPQDLQKKTEKDYKGAVQSFDLPFDVLAHMYIKNLKYMQRSVEDVQFKTGLKNKALKIEGLEMSIEGDSHVKAHGVVEDIFKLSPFDITLQVNADDLERALSLLKVEQDVVLVPLGKGVLKGRVSGSTQKAEFTANLDVLDTNVEVTGVVTDVINTPNMSSLALRLGHNDYEKFVQMFVANYDSAIRSHSKLDVYLDVVQDKINVYNMKQIKASVGSYSLDGDAIVDLNSKTPNVQGFVKGGRVVLSDFVNTGSVSANKPDNASSGKSNTGNGEAKWSRTAINSGWMHQANVDFKFSFDRLVYNDWDMQSLSGQAVLKDGTLDLYNMHSNLYGGTVDMSGRLKSDANPREPLSMNFTSHMKDVSFPGLVKAAGVPQVIRGEAGKVNFDVDVSSTGLSPAAIVYGLNGKGSIDGEGIVVSGFDLSKLAKAVSKESSQFKQWKRLGEQAIKGVLKGGTTRFDAALGTFVIEEGIVKTNDLILQNQDATVRNQGEVNLPQWTVDITTVIDIAQPEDAPDVTYHYSGSIGSPVANMNADNLLQYGISKAVDKLIEDKAGDIINKILKVPEPSNENTKSDGQPSAPKPEDVFRGLLKDVISR